jgi:hypothetical protein
VSGCELGGAADAAPAGGCSILGFVSHLSPTSQRAKYPAAVTWITLHGDSAHTSLPELGLIVIEHKFLVLQDVRRE